MSLNIHLKRVSYKGKTISSAGVLQTPTEVTLKILGNNSEGKPLSEVYGINPCLNNYFEYLDTRMSRFWSKKEIREHKKSINDWVSIMEESTQGKFMWYLC